MFGLTTIMHIFCMMANIPDTGGLSFRCLLSFVKILLAGAVCVTFSRPISSTTKMRGFWLLFAAAVLLPPILVCECCDPRTHSLNILASLFFLGRIWPMIWPNWLVVASIMVCTCWVPVVRIWSSMQQQELGDAMTRRCVALICASALLPLYSAWINVKRRREWYWGSIEAKAEPVSIPPSSANETRSPRTLTRLPSLREDVDAWKLQIRGELDNMADRQREFSFRSRQLLEIPQSNGSPRVPSTAATEPHNRRRETVAHLAVDLWSLFRKDSDFLAVGSVKRARSSER